MRRLAYATLMSREFRGATSITAGRANAEDHGACRNVISMQLRPQLILAVSCMMTLGIALVLLSGCTSQTRMHVQDLMADKKDASLTGWENALLEGESLVETVGETTALVLRNFESVSAGGENGEFNIEAITNLDRAGFGSAAPISRDGYFLSAGHVVRDASSLTLVLVRRQEDGSPELQSIPAQVVWKAKGNGIAGSNVFDPDIAVIHAKTSPRRSFGIASAPPKTNDPIIVSGWPLQYFETFYGGARLAAGRILSVDSHDPDGTSPPVVVIRHNAPLVSGDSGGPILNRNGDLIGINSTGRVSLSIWQRIRIGLGFELTHSEKIEYSNLAIMPDQNWLQELMEEDRATRNCPNYMRYSEAKKQPSGEPVPGEP